MRVALRFEVEICWCEGNWARSGCRLYRRLNVEANNFDFRFGHQDFAGTLEQKAKIDGSRILGHAEHDFVFLPILRARNRSIVHVVERKRSGRCKWTLASVDTHP